MKKTGKRPPAALPEGEELYKVTLEAAAKQLSYRALSEKTLREKLLEKGYPEEAVEYAVLWLQERSLLNDEVYAQGLVRRYEKNGYGARRIRQELTQRGVDAETATEVLAEYEPAQEEMLKVLRKRLRGDMSVRKEVDKAVAALQRRGFGWQEIKEALDLYAQEVRNEE